MTESSPKIDSMSGPFILPAKLKYPWGLPSSIVGGSGVYHLHPVCSGSPLIILGKSSLLRNLRTKFFDLLSSWQRYLAWKALDTPISWKYFKTLLGVSSSWYLKRNTCKELLLSLGGLAFGMWSSSGLLRLRALTVCHAGLDGTAGLVAPPLLPLTNGLDGLGVVFLLLEGELRVSGGHLLLRKNRTISYLWYNCGWYLDMLFKNSFNSSYGLAQWHVVVGRSERERARNLSSLLAWRQWREGEELCDWPVKKSRHLFLLTAKSKWTSSIMQYDQ